jgi:uric acid transporter
MGLVDFSSVADSSWIGISAPFHFGQPKFAAAAVISMCIVVLVTYTESTADMLAVGEMVGRNLSPNDLARGLATDGRSALLAGFMNSFPDTAYAENGGLIGMTGVRSRWVVTVCGVFLVILGLIPKVGAIVAALPGPVMVVFVLNLVFNHWGAFGGKHEGVIDTAVGHGAVSGSAEPAEAERRVP